MHRRRFLWTLSLGSLASLLFGPRLAASASAPRTSPNRAVLRAFARVQSRSIPPSERRTIGRAYLRQCPDEADAQALTSAVADASAPRARSAAALDRRIRADFAADRTVCVRGWVLSRTEARLYALATLS